MSLPPNGDRPFFQIIAGPNGSGKSSAYQEANLKVDGRSVWIINPDLLTARIQAVEQLDVARANVEAVRRIEAWLDASIDAHQTVGVETVLSTPKYRRLVEKAKARGFAFRLMYVLLDSPARNIERVKLRVSKGGHDVPEAKIIARHARSLAQLPWFLDEADLAWIYDNSGASPRLVGTKAGGRIAIDPDVPRDVIDAIGG